jgi:hypothetical protein
VPEFLLRHRGELTLSAEQVKKITVVAAAYRHDIAPFKPQVAAATAAYQKYLERTQNEKRPEMAEIEKQGAEVQRLSNILATSRHSYWKQARAVLTPQQQQRADALVTTQAKPDDLR